MKVLYLSFFIAIIFSANTVFSQDSNSMSQGEDWSQLFPEIPNCERVIQPMTRNGEVFEQVAVYRRQTGKEVNNEGYIACGSITLRFEPSARETARERFKNLPFRSHRQVKIKNFDVYQNSPLCGNDGWEGSTSVYFDKDKVLIADAYRGAAQILEFAPKADYELMKITIDKFVKRENQTR